MCRKSDSCFRFLKSGFSIVPCPTTIKSLVFVQASEPFRFNREYRTNSMGDHDCQLKYLIVTGAPLNSLGACQWAGIYNSRWMFASWKKFGNLGSAIVCENENGVGTIFNGIEPFGLFVVLLWLRNSRWTLLILARLLAWTQPILRRKPSYRLLPPQVCMVRLSRGITGLVGKHRPLTRIILGLGINRSCVQFYTICVWSWVQIFKICLSYRSCCSYVKISLYMSCWN